MASPQTANRFPWNVSSWIPPQPHWSRKLVLSYVVAGVVIFIDQLTKAFSSSFVVNHGISFGLLSSWLNMWVAIIFPVILLICMWSMLKKYPIILGLFQGGAVSNFLDRLLYGGVRDWLTVPVFGLRNNFADWAIVIALVWYGIMLR